ncbi:MAG TPA: MFS transporter [Microlunatus sp.]|nr:MFS transporter [Microlunatus sp.]
MSQSLSTETRRKEVRRVILSSYFGTSIEYYDFLLYTSAASLVFARVFFSDAPPAIGTILSFVTLLAGYLARPLGGIIFGHFGDRLGRRKMLLITMALMGTASTLIGVLPTYAQVGALAPVLLVILRVVQGIAVGGDWGGSATLSVEAAENGKRGLTAAFVNMGAPTGAVVAALVLAAFGAMNDDAFLSWGWRVPFLLSAVLVAVGLRIRYKMSESPLFAEMQAKAEEQEKKEVPIVAVLTNQWGAVLLAAFGTLCAFALQGLLASYALTLGVQTGGQTRSTVLLAFSVGSVLQIGGLAFYAHLSDRFGRRPVMTFGAVLGIVLAYPIFAMIASGSTALLFVGMIIGMPIVQSAIYGPAAAFISEMFSTRYRYTGASLGYQTASTLGGGVSPLIAASLAAAGGFAPVAIYISITFVVGLVIIRLAKEGTRVDLHDVTAERPLAGPTPAAVTETAV